MKIKSVLLASVVLAALPAAAWAEPKDSWYLDLGAGGNWVDDTDGILTSSGGATAPYDLGFDTGWAGAISAGYNWGRFRLEFELGYRQNDVDFFNSSAVHASGEQKTYAQMVNVLVDLELVDRVSLSLGVGVGGALVDVHADGSTALATASIDDDDYVFAYQGIAGINIDVGERTELFLEYRYFATDDAGLSGASTPGPVAFTTDDFQTINHSALFGLRYFFGEPEVATPEEPAPTETSAPQTNFAVMFDYNKANLSAEGQAVVAEAADALKGGATSVTIEANGDGQLQMDKKLSDRRGAAVKGGLVALGIAADKIAVATHESGDATITATQ